ncbi:ser/Thr protein phosphatase [Xylariaceae sp. FL0255]|nr:ser/Thr protein phosphatase [Xylariaceae sp. FL0255]
MDQDSQPAPASRKDHSQVDARAAEADRDAHFRTHTRRYLRPTRPNHHPSSNNNNNHYRTVGSWRSQVPCGDIRLEDPELTSDLFQQPRQPYNAQGYLPNGASAASGPVPGATPLLPNQGRVLQQGSIRVLCIADVRGNLSSLNDLARQARADHIIHTGDFGFYDETSLDRIAEKTLKHVAQYSPLISESVKKAMSQPGPVKSKVQPDQLPLSQLPQLIKGEIKLEVPVYTVWGACEDVRVLEKFRSNEYKVPNLHIIDENRSMLLEVGGVKLRLLGLGGAVVMHKLFDNGEGRTTIAGGQGTMWTTLLQMGELVDTANRVYDPTETRVFITHASPAREGILNQLSVSLKADFSISAGLHFRYGSSYNEFSVNPTLDHYRGKLAASKASFNDVWETVKTEVEPAIQQNEAQQNLLKNALALVDKMPSTAAGGNPFGGPVGAPGSLGQVDESAFKNMWNFNLADAAFGWLVLEIQDGRIGTEMRAQGFNFSHRGAKQQPNMPQSTPSPAPPVGGLPPASAAPPTGAPPSGPQRSTSAAAPAPKPAAATPLQTKPATPKPAASAAPPKETEKASNGAGNAPETAPSPGPRPSADAIIGLFVMNVQSDEQTRDIFPEDLKTKITKVDKWGNNSNNKVAHFATIEERDAAYASLADEFKVRQSEDRSKPLVKIFQPRENKIFNTRAGGAGNWGSNRGRDSASGYRSAGDRGAMSGGESGPETGRSRGGRGGRGGRGDRGGRGGGGRGRGGVSKGDGGASPAPAAES